VLEMPVPFGPRNCDQSSPLRVIAETDACAITQKIKNASKREKLEGRIIG
jgi:hypothetical protein